MSAIFVRDNLFEIKEDNKVDYGFYSKDSKAFHFWERQVLISATVRANEEESELEADWRNEGCELHGDCWFSKRLDVKEGWKSNCKQLDESEHLGS